MNELLTQLLMQIPADTAGDIFRLDSYDSDDSGPIFWLLGPVAGVGFYVSVYLRYRNTNKRHEFEHHTASEMTDVKVSDNKVGTVKGTESRELSGANSSRHLARLGAGTSVTEAYKRNIEQPEENPETGPQ